MTAELTSTARKIMEVFRYYRLRKDDYLSIGLLQSKRHLWRDVEEEDFNDALQELALKGLIGELESPYGWRLLEEGYRHIKASEEGA